MPPFGEQEMLRQNEKLQYESRKTVPIQRQAQCRIGGLAIKWKLCTTLSEPFRFGLTECRKTRKMTENSSTVLSISE
jgi:hypothetical protein